MDIKQRALTFFVLLAFIFNIFLPFFAVYSIPPVQAADDPAELSSLFGDKILICTSDGFKWMTWEELQNEGNPHSPEKPRYECALCYIAAHGSKDFLKSSDQSIAFAAISLTDASLSHSDDVLRSKALPRSYHSRAPPVSA